MVVRPRASMVPASVRALRGHCSVRVRASPVLRLPLVSRAAARAARVFKAAQGLRDSAALARRRAVRSKGPARVGLLALPVRYQMAGLLPVLVVPVRWCVRSRHGSAASRRGLHVRQSRRRAVAAVACSAPRSPTQLPCARMERAGASAPPTRSVSREAEGSRGVTPVECVARACLRMTTAQRHNAASRRASAAFQAAKDLRASALTARSRPFASTTPVSSAAERPLTASPRPA